MILSDKIMPEFDLFELEWRNEAKKKRSQH